MEDELREEQAAELEALEAIFGDDYSLLEEPTKMAGARFQVELADDADNNVRIHLVFTHTPKYPHERVLVVVNALSGVSGSRRKVLQTHLDSVAEDSIGMPAAYSICEAARDWLAEHVVGGVDDDDGKGQDEASKFETLDTTQQERVEIISSKSVGTPVTIENFQQWRENFLQDLKASKTKEQIELETNTKMTGREFFESRTVVLSEKSASFWESEASQLEGEL